ncbi:MAG: hypothetical protein JSW05_03310 [Candidatus Thorarchaeota archaeon]|nr:MAG: hypothetical protein JSW05_03310 [Candidatus Thorarchaeota archaeon]
MLVSAKHGRRRSYIFGFAERFGFRNEFELDVKRIDDSSNTLSQDATGETSS